jgi:hypothetical protein
MPALALREKLNRRIESEGELTARQYRILQTAKRRQLVSLDQFLAQADHESLQRDFDALVKAGHLEVHKSRWTRKRDSPCYVYVRVYDEKGMRADR